MGLFRGSPSEAFLFGERKRNSSCCTTWQVLAERLAGDKTRACVKREIEALYSVGKGGGVDGLLRLCEDDCLRV